ncbi:hypothetical protein J41TS12_30850 [Paenibacillus antibioticophila]|uniref:Uncharacterized protein n=1 Tax=Paenibacillus antibioticophila TaxID=1274374 RepID=A0A919XSH7_9BACL|nr:hypothetical protein [Paenibacillus antibioticophila]GIO38224.1 hypothetical protein J41TS12_30850 [Paenibacillus antibioticophila]
MSDNKPGIGSTLQTLRTTDEQEIAEVIQLLKDRKIIKLLPDTGPVKNYTDEYQDIRIEFLSDTNLTLEYSIDSLGRVEVKKGTNQRRSNALVLGGSSKDWFVELKALFEEKKQSSLWF